ALLRSSIDAPDSLTEQLRGDDSGLLRAALRLLPEEDSRLVLVIDQFEELFTLVTDETVRQRFLDQLLVAADDAYGRIVVVITLRADFYGRPLEYPAFGERLGSGVVNVVPLSSDELEAAAIEPARRSGVTFEPALLAEILTDVIGQPGALPMFQYTLTELFDRRVGNVLTIGTFRAMGGVRGALTQRADDLYNQLDPGEKEAAQQLLLRLVAISDHDEWSRRRVHASEIVALDVDVVAMQRVIEVFGAHRLLSFDRDQVSGAPTVEVAHEALLHEWERLRQWIEENREDLLQHRELAGAANRWHGAGRDQDYLYTGGRLDEYVNWNETSPMKLTARERDFLDEGLARQRADEDVEQERLIREEHLQRSTKRRTWGLVAAVLVLVVGAVGVLWAVTRSEGPKIALIQENEGSLQALIEQGWNQADRELNFDAERVVTLIDPEEDMRALAAAGYELIIDGTFDAGETAYAVAPDFPDVSFVVFDDEEPALENVTAIHFVREGGAYLMGVAAALQSETGKIGFIGGFQAATTESRRASFTAGARSIQPDIVVESVFLGPFHFGGGGFLDYDLAKATAEDLYRSGTDVIHHSAGTAGLGIPAAAAELTDELGRELWVIGTEVEEQRLVPPEQRGRFLTSMWKRWDQAVYEAVRAYMAGELEPGLHEIGLASRSVDYSQEGGLSDARVAMLDEIRADIVASDVDPRAAATEPPRWTREPTATVNLVFNGVTCASDLGPTELARGDVVVVNLINESDVDVGIAFEIPEDVYGSGVMTTFTAPGSRNAAAMRLLPGTYAVSCFTEDRGYQGSTFTAHFETTCEGPAVASGDPTDVIRAYVDAANARDADAVCSLFADDAVVLDLFGQPGFNAEGNWAIAETVTPLDDDNAFRGLVITDIDAVDGTVIWSSESEYLGEVSSTTGHRSVVEDGKIIRWEWGSG
ncbi:MAG: BMP family ABC transporter substrate-binding protein, partial [Actinomycetota bacterium]|nr:BMP family ABC transporter substrate-binding protein [Actinomycetota bacterium]